MQWNVKDHHLRHKKIWNKANDNKDKEYNEEHKQWDTKKCDDMITTNDEKDMPIGPKLMKLLNKACIRQMALVQCKR